MTVMRLSSQAGKCFLQQSLSLSHLYLRARVDECHMLFASRTAAQNMFGLKWFRPARERQVLDTICAGDNNIMPLFFVLFMSLAAEEGRDTLMMNNQKRTSKQTLMMQDRLISREKEKTAKMERVFEVTDQPFRA